jgi:hypothetical protein
VLDEPPALVWYAIVYCDAYCLCMCSAAFVCCITLFCPFACFFLWSSMLNSGWVTPVLGPDSGACPDWASDIHGSVVLVAAAMYIATRVNQSINQSDATNVYCHSCKSINQSKGCHKLDLAMYISTYVISSWALWCCHSYYTPTHTTHTTNQLQLKYRLTAKQLHTNSNVIT